MAKFIGRLKSVSALKSGVGQYGEWKIVDVVMEGTSLFPFPQSLRITCKNTLAESVAEYAERNNMNGEIMGAFVAEYESYMRTKTDENGNTRQYQEHVCTNLMRLF